ncbi:MAG: methyltransferase domain-containing protein [Planctomycetes bacterium]|nr:methyltransferase domain-containing protein [Planctomycetota bacterium]
MREWMLEYLRCPATKAKLRVEQAVWRGNEVQSGMLVSRDGTLAYPIIGGIPRMLPGVRTEDDLRRVYADSFGYQWTHFQWERVLDESEYFAISDQTPDSLREKTVLDAGCGGGRVSRVLAKHCRRLIGLDFTIAVDRARTNTRSHSQCEFVQGDVLRPPLANEAFDYVWCHGVLHHTSDARAGVCALAGVVKPGGELHIVLFLKAWAPLRATDVATRALIRRLPYAIGVKVCRVMGTLRHLPAASFWKRFVWFSLQPSAELRTCCNFDWYMPRYHHEHTVDEVRSWFRDGGFTRIRYINGWPYANAAVQRTEPSFWRRARLGQLFGVAAQKQLTGAVATKLRSGLILDAAPTIAEQESPCLM